MNNNQSKKISELETINSLSSVSRNKEYTWLPAAFYDIENNSYKNVAISLNAITNYCNSYSSYMLSYELGNYTTNSEVTYVTYNTTYNTNNDDIISYVSSYTSYLLNNAVEKLSDNIVKLSSNIKPTSEIEQEIINNSRKISELTGRDTITRHQDHSWIPLAQFDSRTNTYHNIAINLKTITEYCNSYCTYQFIDVDDRLRQQENTINKILNSYLAYITYGNSIPPSYIMSYCSSYTSYLIQDATEKISKNMVILIDSIKNKNNNSYIRNNSKKISELKGRDTITTYQYHSWFALAQYDQRTNSYHNIAINLGTITSYCNSYSSYLISYTKDIVDDELRELTYELMSYTVNYVDDSLKFQYLEEGYEPQITLDDIQDLVLDKKLVTLNSEHYTPEAFEYIKTKVYENESILFDTYNHLIWTLGNRFGSDILKNDLLYYSTIKSIDDNGLINELEAIGPEQILSFKQHNGLKISLNRDNSQDIIDFELQLNEIIRSDSLDRYFLYIDENNKIGIKVYKEPIISVSTIEYTGQEDIELNYIIDSTIPIENWKLFEVSGVNCEIINVDKENSKIQIRINPENYINDIDEKIIIKYNDGYIIDEYSLDHIFKTYCYYGCYRTDTLEYVELGKYEIDNGSIEHIFDIDQQNRYYAYYRCPKKHKVIFVDNIRHMEGAWQKEFNVVINTKTYKTYLTQHPGLGNIQWKVLENI